MVNHVMSATELRNLKTLQTQKLRKTAVSRFVATCAHVHYEVSALSTELF
jgi:hypothetical protein